MIKVRRIRVPRLHEHESRGLYEDDDLDAPHEGGGHTELDVLRRALSRRARRLSESDVPVERGFVELHVHH